MELVFKSGNENVELGWASNNSCRLVEIILDEREPDDPGTGEMWELQYMPAGFIVEPVGIDRHEVGTVSDDLADGTFFVGPKHELERLEIPVGLASRAGLPPQHSKKVKIRRDGFKLMPAVAATDFFAQGQTFRGSAVIIDMRIPPDGKVSLSSIYVMLSRATTLDDIYLLHPLWIDGDEEAKKKFLESAKSKFKFDLDAIAAEKHLRERHESTVASYKDVPLHYVDYKSGPPYKCSLCQEPV